MKLSKIERKLVKILKNIYEKIDGNLRKFWGFGGKYEGVVKKALKEI